MKIWLSKNSEVPVREQIMTQIKLGIASGELANDARLPSTNEIAQRFGVHPNTVSSAYRKLVETGFLRFKKGSGFYVRGNQNSATKGENLLDELVEELFRRAGSHSFTVDEIREAFQKRLAFKPPEKIVLIESDQHLRDILNFELREALERQIYAVSFEDFAEKYYQKKAIFVALKDEKPKIEKILSASAKCVYLKSPSVAESMKGSPRPSANDLIAVVSGWDTFLLLAKTMLIAAKIDPECLILRPTRETEWHNGLNSASLIICDSLTEGRLSGYKNVRRFALISAESIQEIEKIQSLDQ